MLAGLDPLYCLDAIHYIVRELRKLASREQGYLAAAVAHQIRWNLPKRMGDVESWLFPDAHMRTLSPGELSAVQEPAMGGGRGRRVLCAAGSGPTAKCRSDGKKDTFKSLKVAAVLKYTAKSEKQEHNDADPPSWLRYDWDGNIPSPKNIHQSLDKQILQNER
ncbi:hypothetical protein QYF61_009494 [Mycteria americana]|uniref:Uncharacterized protein n=1 Tax=Mycteria americana TaxID=33587 RepID=A0AAN7NSQ5_MYCAM|nr:hypothetical protein QYF61_009494 [Mycteria americana]